MRRYLSKEAYPFHGQTRRQEGMLWFPKTIDNKLRWWEWAKWQETYKALGYGDGDGKWHASMWLNS